MLYRRTDVTDAVQRLVQLVDSTYVSNVLNPLLDVVVDRVVGAHFWKGLIRQKTLATIVNRQRYNLPFDFAEMLFMRQVESEAQLHRMSSHEYFELVPDPSDDTGPAPTVYVDDIEDGSQQANPLATAETIIIVSSSTSDTSQVVSLHGEVSGVEDYEDLSLNGTTNVTSTKTFTSLYNASKSGTSVGRVTISGTTSSDTYAVIPPESFTVKYKKILLHPVPTKVITMTFQYKKRISRFSADNDAFELAELGDVLINGLWSMALAERRRFDDAKDVERTWFLPALRRAIRNDRQTRDLESRMVVQGPARVNVLPLDHPFNLEV